VGIFLQMSDGEEDRTVLTGRFTKQELRQIKSVLSCIFCPFKCSINEKG
jgi:hypothetical protein